jgi:hypothetical protein
MVGVACNLDDQNEGRRHLKQNGYFAHHPGEQQITDLFGADLGCWVEHIGEMRPRPCLEQPFEPLAKREIDHGKQERYADPADAARRIVALQSPLGLTGKACSAAENVLEALAKLERVSFEPFPHRPHAGSAIYGHGRGVRRFNNQNLCAGFLRVLNEFLDGGGVVTDCRLGSRRRCQHQNSEHRKKPRLCAQAGNWFIHIGP